MREGDRSGGAGGFSSALLQKGIFILNYLDLVPN